MKRELLILLFCIIFYFTIELYTASKFESGKVYNVIDGDTIELMNGLKIRLYGINTPESDEYYYGEAKQFLKEKIEFKQIKFKSYGTDQYNRTLALVYYENENVNLRMISEGYATPYFTSKNSILTEINLAFEKCVENQIGLCKSSMDLCALCIKLKELNYTEEYFTLENKCDYDCNLNNWHVKDSTSKNRFILTNVTIKGNSEMHFYTANGINSVYGYYLCSSKNCPPIWNNDFDSFYLRSSDGGLVIYFNYFSS